MKKIRDKPERKKAKNESSSAVVSALLAPNSALPHSSPVPMTIPNPASRLENLSMARMGTLKIRHQNLDETTTTNDEANMEKEEVEDPLNVTQSFLLNSSPHPSKQLATLHSWQKSIEFPQFLEAAEKGKLDMVTLAIETARDSQWINQRHFLGDNETALTKACYNGHLTIVEFLVQHKADVNLSNDECETALYKACDAGHEHVVKFLLSHGCAVDQANKSKWTPLCEAARSGHLTIAELLIKHGADINIAASDGKTPLYFAAANGQLLLLKCLIANGADVNKATEEGFTPLCRAAKEGYTAIVDHLISVGADIHRSTKSGQTPLHVAAETRAFSAIRSLLLHGDSSSPCTVSMLPHHAPTSHTLFIHTLHTPSSHTLFPHTF